MLELVNQYGNLLNPLSVLLQFLLWTTTGAGFCWGFMRKSLFRKATQIEKLEHDVNFWEQKYVSLEQDYGKLLKSNDPIALLTDRAKHEDHEGFCWILDDWIRSNSPRIAELFGKSAELLVSLPHLGKDSFELAMTRNELARKLDSKNERFTEQERNLSAFRAIVSEMGDEETAWSDWTVDSPTMSVLFRKFDEAMKNGDDLTALLIAQRGIDASRNFEAQQAAQLLANWQSNISLPLANLGRHEESLTVVKRSREVYEACMPPDEVITNRINFAGALLHNGRDQEALEIVRDTIPKAREIVGPKDKRYETLQVCEIVALSLLKDYKSAIALSEDILYDGIPRSLDLKLNIIVRLIGTYKSSGNEAGAIAAARRFSAFVKSTQLDKQRKTDIDLLLNTTLEANDLAASV